MIKDGLMSLNNISWEMFPDRGQCLKNRTIKIKDKLIQFYFMTEHDAESMMPPFEHLRVIEHTTNMHDTFHIYILHDEGKEKKFPIWERLEKAASNDKKLQTYNHHPFHLLYNYDSKVLTGINTDKNEGYYYIPSLSDRPYYEKAAPMRMIFHYWAQAQGLILLHGASVGFNHKGVLMAGRGGSGKSTTALSAALAGFDYLGDDYVIADPNGKTIHSLYGSSKTRWNAEKIIPDIKELAINSGSEDEKGIFFLDKDKGFNIGKSLALKAVLLPVITGGSETCFVKINGTEALMSLASSTIFQMPGSGKELLSEISKLIKDIPQYRIMLGNKPEEINEKLKKMINQLQG
jgi:hypothetical protein